MMVSYWSIARVMLLVSLGDLLVAGFLSTSPASAAPGTRLQRMALSRKVGSQIRHARRRPHVYRMSADAKISNGEVGVIDQLDLSILQDLGGAVTAAGIRSQRGASDTAAVDVLLSTTATKAVASAALMESAPPLPPPTAGEGDDGLEHLAVSQEDDNAPIDWILSRRMAVNSRRYYRKEIEEGGVKVNGKTVTQLVRVAGGSTISVKMGTSTGNVAGGTSGGLQKQKQLLFPQRLPSLKVLFEDEHFFAVQKPAGVVCQPCEGAKQGTVLHGLLDHMVKAGQVEADDLAAARRLSQGIVHRLDKHTSGVMIVAKTLEASSKFSNLFKDGKVKKEYLAICHGDPGLDSLVDVPLYRRSSGKVAAVHKEDAERYGARETVTRIQNVASIGGISLCKAEILTGRMHQVRVHLQWKGCPIVGDKEYGDFVANDRVARRSQYRVVAKRPLLHSMTLEFVHPITNKPMKFLSAMPNDMWDPASTILRASGTPEQRREFEGLQELRLMTPEDKAAAEARAVQDGRRAAAAARVKRLSRGQGMGGSAAARAASAAVAALGRGGQTPE